MPNPTALWEISAPNDIDIREWPAEAEHLVFDQRSGDVHLLSPAAARVLRRLTAGACAVEDLAAHCEGSAETAHEVVRSLDELGLIRPATP